MRPRVYQERVAKAAWAFGYSWRDATGTEFVMLPPRSTRRPGRNVWRHAYVRQKHLWRAAAILNARAGVTFSTKEYRVAYITVIPNPDYWVVSRFMAAGNAARDACDNADWGLTR